MLTYCGKLFTIYVSQIIMLYILNLISVVCQLPLNKTRGKNVSLNKSKAESQRDKSMGPPEDVTMQEVKERDEEDRRFNFSFH